jgi:hypothetical protein
VDFSSSELFRYSRPTYLLLVLQVIQISGADYFSKRLRAFDPLMSKKLNPTPGPQGCALRDRHRLPTGQRENNVDRGIDIHRLAIEVVRLVAPLLDGIQRGAGEHGVAADHVQVLDGAIFAD